MLSKIYAKLRLVYLDTQQEQEYCRLKLPFNKDFFKYLSFSLTVLFIPLTIRYHEKHLYPQTYIGAFFLVLGLIVFLLREKLQNYMQPISIVYVSAVVGMAIYNSHLLISHLQSPEAYYLGYSIAMMQRMFDFRVTKFVPALIFTVVFTVGKFLLIPTPSRDQIGLIVTLEILPILLSFGSEKGDRFLFDSLYKSKNQLIKFKQLLTEHLPNPIAVLTSDYKRVHFANDALKRFFKSEDSEKIKQSLDEFVLENQNSEEGKSLLQKLDYKAQSGDGDELLKLSDMMQLLSCRPEILKAMKVISFQLIEPQNTKKEEEDDIINPKMKLRLKRNKTSDPSSLQAESPNNPLLSSKYGVSRFNNENSSLVERFPGELINKSGFDTQAFPLVTKKNLSEVIEEQAVQTTTIAIDKTINDSQELPKRKVFKVKMFPLAWDDDEAIAIVLDDVTHEKTIIELRVADKNKDLVIAMVSHELRTPLNGMLGLLEIMKKEITQPELLEYLNACKTSSLLLLNLVNSILDFSQIKNNKLKLIYSKVTIDDWIIEIRSLFEYFCQPKGLSFEIIIDPDVPQTIITDPTRLSQVVINLLGNAFKFTFKGGVTLRISAVKGDPKLVQFSVIDTGIGIKKEQQENLFKLFGRLEQQNKKINTQGVGLGLTISNNLAMLLNSTEKIGIKVESEVGKGTTFSFIVQSEDKSKLEEKVGGQGQDEDDENEEEKSCNFIDDSLGSATVVERMATYTEMKFSPYKLKSGQMLPHLDSKYSVHFDLAETNHKNSFANFSEVAGGTSLSLPLVKHVSQTGTPQNSDNRDPKKLTESHFKREVTDMPWCLIVDDNPFNLMVAINIMKDRGFQVKTALNGQEAVNAVQEHHNSGALFKLILMDCQMPVMDGYEATRVLTGMMKKGEVEECPVVALTANNQNEEHEKLCKNAGMSGCLPKPLNVKELEDILKRTVKVPFRRSLSYRK